MTVQTQIHNGREVQTRTYRKIYMGLSLAHLIEGFYAQESSNKWGKLTQLKGKERIVLHTFGEVEQ